MASRVKASANPALIAWARESAGFTPAEAGEKIGVSAEQVTAWEAADGEQPSIPQLRKVANLFKRPLAVFYLPEVPATFQVMRDLRRLPGAGLRRLSTELQLEIRIANERRELALEFAADLEIDPPSFTLSATTKEDPESVGERIRAALNVTDQAQAIWKANDGRAGLNGWRARIEDLGVLVFQATRIQGDEASGFAIAADKLPVIVVNRKDAPVRRTFSLLHEFAHLMVRVSGVSDLESDAKRPPEDQAIEVFCNGVAAAALMPKETLLRDPRVIAQGARSRAWSDEQLRDLARGFNVSREALLRRLLTFDRTTQKFYREKRAQYSAEFEAERAHQKNDPGEIKRNMPVETVSNVGRPLVRMILGNYYQDRITLSDVSGYLGLKTRHIANLERAIGAK